MPGGKRRTTACADDCASARELLAPRVTHLAHAVSSDDTIGEGDDGSDQREDDEDGVSGAELGADAEGFVEDDVDASENAERKANVPPRMHALYFFVRLAMCTRVRMCVRACVGFGAHSVTMSAISRPSERPSVMISLTSITTTATRRS